MSDPPTAMITSKRTSDAAFGGTQHNVKREEDLDAASPKRLRLDIQASGAMAPRPPIMTPGALAYNHGTGSGPQLSLAAIDDARERLRDVLAEISHLEPILERALRKTDKSKGDHTRIVTHQRQLGSLHQTRDALRAQITVATMVPQPNAPQFPLGSTHAFGFRHPPGVPAFGHINQPQYRPAIEQKPFATPVFGQPSQLKYHAAAGTSQLHPNTAAPPAFRQMAVPQSRHTTGAPQLAQKPVVVVKREHVNAVASGSGSRSIPSPVARSPARVKSEVKKEEPITSINATLNKRLSAGIPGLSDSESEMDDDVGNPFTDPEAGGALARDLLRNLGMDVPAPIYDARDEDGLFFGRGRDLYTGPQANAGECVNFIFSPPFCFDL